MNSRFRLLKPNRGSLIRLRLNRQKPLALSKPPTKLEEAADQEGVSRSRESNAELEAGKGGRRLPRSGKRLAATWTASEIDRKRFRERVSPNWLRVRRFRIGIELISLGSVRTCRDYRPSAEGQRGWCANSWAFTHRRLVLEDDPAPCQSAIGDWWLPVDDVWLVAADVSSHGRATPLLDRLTAKADQQRRRS